MPTWTRPTLSKKSRRRSLQTGPALSTNILGGALHSAENASAILRTDLSKDTCLQNKHLPRLLLGGIHCVLLALSVPSILHCEGRSASRWSVLISTAAGVCPDELRAQRHHAGGVAGEARMPLQHMSARRFRPFSSSSHACPLEEVLARNNKVPIR